MRSAHESHESAQIRNPSIRENSCGFVGENCSFKLKFIVLALLAACSLLVFPMIGSTDVLHDPAGMEILLKLRIPRVLTAFLAGVALATSGMIFQALFRNPLSTPFTLGVSGDAAHGAPNELIQPEPLNKLFETTFVQKTTLAPATGEFDQNN